VRAERLQPPHDLGDPRGIIGQMTLCAAGTHRHVQRGLGHVDPDDHVVRLVQLSSLVPSCVTTRLA